MSFKTDNSGVVTNVEFHQPQYNMDVLRQLTFAEAQDLGVADVYLEDLRQRHPELAHQQAQA